MSQIPFEKETKMAKEYTDDSYREAYERFQLASTSGHCDECGWEDGDGVTTCFYGSVIGAVTHQDSPAAVAARMTDSQRSLMESYESRLVYWDEESERLIHEADAARYHHPPEWVAQQIAKPLKSLQGQEFPRYAHQSPDYSNHKVWWIPARLQEREFWPSRFRPAGTVVRYTDAGKQYEYTTSEDQISYMVHIYKPHSCGKGHGKFIAPYHFGCTGCGEQVKLWEFGVDPDCG
jgi:hypothetical protein